MNIFVTHPDPHKSAMVLPDKYIVKMPVETTQMVSRYFLVGIVDGVMSLRRTVNLTILRRVHSEIIHVLSGLLRIIIILLG